MPAPASAEDRPDVPPLLRAALEERWGEGRVLALALVDRDADWRPVERWLILTGTSLSLWMTSGDGAGWRCDVEVERSRIARIDRSELLAGNRWQLRSADGEMLLEINTRRWWRPAVEALLHPIERRLADPGDAPAAVAPAWDDVVARWQKLADAPLEEKRLRAPESGRATWRRLAGYVRQTGRRVLAGLVAAVLVTALGLVPAYVIGQLVDDVVHPVQEGRLTIELGWQQGLLLLGWLGVALLLRGGLHWLRLNLLATAGERVAQALRHDVFRRLSGFELSWFSRQHSGAIISRVVADTDRVWELVAFGVVEGLLAVAMLLAVAGVLLAIDWQLGLLLLLPLPLLGWALRNHSRSMSRLYTRAWRAWSRAATVIGDLVGGIAVVRAFGQGERERRRFEGASMAMNRSYLEVHRSWTRFVPLVLLALQVVTLLAYALALPRLLGMDGVPPLSTGQFVTVVMLLGMVVGPVEALAQMARMTDRSLSSARRVFELMDAAKVVNGASHSGARDSMPDETNDPRQGVRIEGLHFAYDPSLPVLRGLDLEIGSGEVVGLIGGSGTGKSTLLQILAGLHEPGAGRVVYAARGGGDRVDRVEGAIGWVPQEPFLFSGSVWDNVIYGLAGDAVPGRVAADMRAAAAHEFVLRLPLGYDTPLGERGGRLSGGERQRLALARALAGRPRLLLLDETTSQLDGALEQRIITALRQRAAADGTATLWVSHRLSSLRAADRVAVLEGGIVAEQGTPSDLCRKQDSRFLRAWRQQHGGEPWDRELLAEGITSESAETAPTIFVDPQGGLMARKSGGPGGPTTESRLLVRPWFPMSAPNQWLSLTDAGSGAEVWHGAGADAFPDPGVRAAIERERLATVARPEVGRIVRIKDADDLRRWHVVMSGGVARVLWCAADEWPESAKEGWWLRDVAGDIVWLPQALRDDPASWRQLWPYVEEGVTANGPVNQE